MEGRPAIHLKHTAPVQMLAVVALAVCSPEKTAVSTPPAPAMATPAIGANAQQLISLPVSLNAVMVALVDHASEPLRVDAYEPPTTDTGWREAEYNAYQMAIAAKLIQLPALGPNDADWVVEPKWAPIADEMSAAGLDALKAAQARDVAALDLAGDRLVAACETCHKEFKPNLASMGLYKSPNYPPK